MDTEGGTHGNDDDVKLRYLQLLSYGTDTSTSALNDVSEALARNTCLERVRLLIPPHFFQDDDDDGDGTPDATEETFRVRQLLCQRIGALPKLEQLKIDSYTGMESFPVQTLHKILYPARKLKELELWDLHLTFNDNEMCSGAKDFEMLRRSLQGHPTLQKFTLYNCRLKGSSASATSRSGSLDPLLHALAMAPKLEQVYITAAAAVSSVTSSVTFSSSALEHLCHSTSLRELGLWKFEFLKYQQHQRQQQQQQPFPSYF